MVGFGNHGYSDKTDGEKAAEITALRVPRNRKEVRQKLGIVNYYRKFIPGRAAIAGPIYALLKEHRKFGWNKMEETLLRISRKNPEAGSPWSF